MTVLLAMLRDHSVGAALLLILIATSAAGLLVAAIIGARTFREQRKESARIPHRALRRAGTAALSHEQ